MKSIMTTLACAMLDLFRKVLRVADAAIFVGQSSCRLILTASLPAKIRDSCQLSARGRILTTCGRTIMAIFAHRIPCSSSNASGPSLLLACSRLTAAVPAAEVSAIMTAGYAVPSDSSAPRNRCSSRNAHSAAFKQAKIKHSGHQIARAAVSLDPGAPLQVATANSACSCLLGVRQEETPDKLHRLKCLYMYLLVLHCTAE